MRYRPVINGLENSLGSLAVEAATGVGNMFKIFNSAGFRRSSKSTTFACMNKIFLLSLVLLASVPAAGQGLNRADGRTVCPEAVVCPSGCDARSAMRCHPWYGKRVAFLGDSMTDPRNDSGDIRTKYWGYLQEWLGITPYVYGISGRQWNDIPRQAEKLKAEHADSVDAITVFIGTNDFNAGVPVGRWYDESEDSVLAAVHGPKKYYLRKRRVPSMDGSTFKGRINKGIQSLKTLFPDKQIVLLTPIHRARAEFSDTNLQPDESWQNACGEYFDAYVQAVKEAANVWGIPVIDLNALIGVNPLVEAQQQYFHDAATDLLHPNYKGHRRLAATLMAQLAALPVDF